MTSHPLTDNGYIPPLCSLIYLDAETNVCYGTDTPGHDYEPGINLGDLDDDGDD